jgi:hypothetical protein
MTVLFDIHKFNYNTSCQKNYSGSLGVLTKLSGSWRFYEIFWLFMCFIQDLVVIRWIENCNMGNTERLPSLRKVSSLCWISCILTPIELLRGLL